MVARSRSSWSRHATPGCRCAAWLRRRGAAVVLVPPERAADLRAYYAKHTKTDPLDSRLLARLPLLHPDGSPRGAGARPR